MSLKRFPRKSNNGGMETLLSLELELANNVRRQTLNGREYVVADVIMLREGVLNGSKGPLYYPPEEIAKRPGIWNGFPLTANHPSDQFGNPVSARSPSAWHQFTIGHVFNDQYNPSTTERSAQAWFDVEICNKVNPKIIPAVLSGQKINVSTGLFTTDEQIDNTRNHKGKEYKHIARNYQPDHLAVLLNDLGACSVKDGCGINLNSEGSAMRKDLVSWLVTNCECWKSKEPVLNDEKSFTEDDLKKLKDNAEASTLAINTLKKVGSELKIDASTTLASLPEAIGKAVTNATTMSAAEKKKAEDAKDKGVDYSMENPDGSKKTMNAETFKANVLTTLKGLTEKEYLDNAPPSINALITNAKQVTEEKKIDIIKALVANVTDEATKKAQILKLNKKSLEDLKEMYELIGNRVTVDTKTEDDKFLANFFGAQGGANNSNGISTYNRNDVLMPSPAFNHSKDNSEEVVTEVVG